jgi:hypothetical protein
VRKLVFITLSISFLLFSCKKKKTSWISDWGAPIICDTLNLTNYYNDSTIESSDGSTLNFNLSRTILDVGINDLIQIRDTIISQSTNSSINLNNIPAGSNFINQTEEHDLNIDGIQLKKVIISSGNIKVRVFNPIGTKVYFSVQIPGATKNGILFEQTYFVEGGTQSNPGIKEEILDLSGYTLDLSGLNQLSYNKIQSKLIIKSDPDGPAVSITTADLFKFDAEISGVKIDYAKGYFGNEIVSDTSDLEIDFLNKLISGSLDLPATSLAIEIENGTKISMRSRLTLAQNTNSAGNTITLSSSIIGNDFIVSPATGSWNSLNPSNQSLELNSNNSNIEQFLENLGSKNKIGYSLQLNPWGNLTGGNDEIFPNSRIKLKIKCQMPLSIGVDGLTLRDTFDINIPNDDSKTHILSGKFTLTATNAFPLSCQPILYLMDENNFILHTIIGSSEISSALFGTIDTNDELLKKKSVVEFKIDETIAKNLPNTKKVILEGILNTPSPVSLMNESYNIPYGAFLSVNLSLSLKTKIVL